MDFALAVGAWVNEWSGPEWEPRRWSCLPGWVLTDCFEIPTFGSRPLESRPREEYSGKCGGSKDFNHHGNVGLANSLGGRGWGGVRGGG